MEILVIRGLFPGQYIGIDFVHVYLILEHNLTKGPVLKLRGIGNWETGNTIYFKNINRIWTSLLIDNMNMQDRH